MENRVTMEHILKAHLMNPSASPEEYNSEVRAYFKKTMQTKQYESEVIEADISMKVPTRMTGAERLFIQTALQSQLEYEVYVGLYLKAQITEAEFNQRKAVLEQQLTTIKAKAESVLGKSINYLLE